MNLLHLKYAIEVEKTGSITQAAENLYMGQPNLSKAIKELETDMGIRIFKRTSKGVIVTRAGEELLIHAKSILAQINEIELLYKPENRNQVVMNISASRDSYAYYALLRFLNDRKKSKSVKINFQEYGGMDVIKSVMDSEYTLGIVHYKTVFENFFLNFLLSKNIEFEPLHTFDCMAIMSKKHPFADFQEVAYGDLAKYVQVAYEDLVIPPVSFMSLKKLNESRQTDNYVRVNDRSTQLALLNRISESFTVNSPLPESLLKQYGLVQRKCLQINYKLKDILIYAKGYKKSSYEKEFIRQLYNVKNDLEESMRGTAKPKSKMNSGLLSAERVLP